MNALLKDITEHMLRDRAYENNTPQLLSILNKILAHMKSLRCVCERIVCFQKLLPSSKR